MNKHEFYFAWLQTVLHGLPRFKNSRWPKINWSHNCNNPVKMNHDLPRLKAVNRGKYPKRTEKCLESHKNGIFIVLKFKVKFGIFDKNYFDEWLGILTYFKILAKFWNFFEIFRNSQLTVITLSINFQNLAKFWKFSIFEMIS